MSKTKDKKLRIGVIMGGPSSEREPSLESGRHVAESLPTDKYEILPIFMDIEKKLWLIPQKLLVLHATDDVYARVEKEAKRIPYEELKIVIDLAFLALHGKYVEDGCFQGLLELQNIPYTGSGVLGSALGMDKHSQRKFLQVEGILYPKCLLISQQDWQNKPNEVVTRIEKQFGFPCIVKPPREGCSTGVSKAENIKEFEKAMEECFKWDTAALIEEFITGVEVTCGVIEDMQTSEPRALTPTETPPGLGNKILTMHDKILPGAAENHTPPRLSPEVIEKIKAVAVCAFKAMKERIYSRIDMWVIGDKVLISEPNTLPGLMPATCLYHQAAEENMMPSDILELIIRLSLKAHKDKKGPLQ